MIGLQKYEENLLKNFLNNFTEILFICHKIHMFKVYNSMIFNKFKELFHHHHNRVLEHFHYSKKMFRAHSHPQLRGPLNLPEETMYPL